MPSPYATHRPTTTRASFSSERSASRARRDLPMPGGPTTVAREHDDSRTAVSNASRSSASSPLRPTKGVVIGRAKAGTSGRRPRSLQGTSGWLLPFASISPAGSAATASRTRS